MYDPKDDLHICHESYCGTGVLGYTIPSTRDIYIDPLKATDPYDVLRVEIHEKQHNVNPDNDEYTNRLLTELRLRGMLIPAKPACCYGP